MAKIELFNINKSYSNDNFENALFSTANAINNPLSSKKESKGMADGSKEHWGDQGQANKNFAINDLNLTIADGEVTVLLGPSGSGKSTILKMIAGLTDYDSGQIKYDGHDVTDLAPKDREIGIVFEDFALYPHQNSRSNILARLIFNKEDKDDQIIEERLEETSKLLGVDIEYLLNKKPAQLSLGERQRVALGRCITRDPKLFLLDEPFASLDARLRDKYRVELKKLLNKFNITTIYVTHSQKEAVALADQIVLIKQGQVEQVGTYQELYNRPANIFVAEFLNADTEAKSVNLISAKKLPSLKESGIIAFRPEDIVIKSNSEQSLSAEVINIELRPTKKVKVVELDYQGELITTKVDINKEIELKDKVDFALEKYHIFEQESKKRIKTVNLRDDN